MKGGGEESVPGNKLEVINDIARLDKPSQSRTPADDVFADERNDPPTTDDSAERAGFESGETIDPREAQPGDRVRLSSSSEVFNFKEYDPAWSAVTLTDESGEDQTFRDVESLERLAPAEAPAAPTSGRGSVPKPTAETVNQAVKNGWGSGNLSTADLKAAVEKDGAEKVAADLAEYYKTKFKKS